MRRLTITFVLISLAACGSTVTEENAAETCETALMRNMVATTLTNQQANIGGSVNPEEAILGGLFQAAATRAALEQAMGPGVTIAEYCASKELSEIRSMALDADMAVAVYASARGIPRTVAEDQIDSFINSINREENTDLAGRRADNHLVRGRRDAEADPLPTVPQDWLEQPRPNQVPPEADFPEVPVDPLAQFRDVLGNAIGSGQLSECDVLGPDDRTGCQRLTRMALKSLETQDWSDWYLSECQLLPNRYLVDSCHQGAPPEPGHSAED